MKQNQSFKQQDAHQCTPDTQQQLIMKTKGIPPISMQLQGTASKSEIAMDYLTNRIHHESTLGTCGGIQEQLRISRKHSQAQLFKQFFKQKKPSKFSKLKFVSDIQKLRGIENHLREEQSKLQQWGLNNLNNIFERNIEQLQSYLADISSKQGRNFLKKLQIIRNLIGFMQQIHDFYHLNNFIDFEGKKQLGKKRLKYIESLKILWAKIQDFARFTSNREQCSSHMNSE